LSLTSLTAPSTAPHKAALVQTWLTERFEEKIIAKNEWPDLNPCDYVKRRFFEFSKKVQIIGFR
jgi:hypothetical protein